MRRTGCLLLLALVTTQAAAQDTTKVPTGVRLSTTYSVIRRPLVAVRPPSGDVDPNIAQQVGTMLQQDLDYSDAFTMGQTPAALASGPLDYGQWSSLNVVFVVASELAPSGQGYLLNVELHDVPFTTIKQKQAFALPAGSAPDFRLAVHAVSDELVRWMTGKPGAAASRIALTRWTPNGSELVIVDSDGENKRRIMTSSEKFYSPAWSPDGRKLAYSVMNSAGRRELRERDLGGGSERVISNRSLISYTPAYAPDGKRIAFSFAIGNGNEIHDVDLERGGAPRRITQIQSRWSDVSPTYSPDGKRIAFSSDRLGQSHIFVTSAEGGQATALTPFSVTRVKFVAPDWSPTTNEVVFHGESRGGFHLMIVDANRGGSAIQITDTGSNEDPSWAPDGRHIVFTGVGSDGSGLYVIDRQTGRTRKLVSGDSLKMPEWSGRLATPSSVAAGN